MIKDKSISIVTSSSTFRFLSVRKSCCVSENLWDKKFIGYNYLGYSYS